MNRIVLITGASRGIGRATALVFAKEKDTVLIHYHTRKKEAEELKEQIEKMGVKASFYQADITQEDEVKDMVHDIISTYGRIDILINNAALALDDDFFSHTVMNFKKVLDVNLIGTFMLSQMVAPYMEKGTIINVASNNGLDEFSPISFDYDASKAGVINLTHNLAKALAPHIRVNAVAPGWTKTEAVLEMNPDDLEHERQRTLLKKLGTPEEVANVILFLASPQASYINSEIIRIDGGIQ